MNTRSTKRSHTPQDLRCFCLRQPLLARYGINDQGKLFIHIKVWKQREIISEVIVTEGRVELRCRECARWHRVRIVESAADLEEITTPRLLADPA